MNKGFLFTGLVALVVIGTGFTYPSPARSTYVLYPAPGDTASFSANAAGNWSLLSSYLDQESADSVDLELILQQSSAVNWRSEQLIGTITNTSFLPAKSQRLTYYLLVDNEWSIRITTSGQCFLSQLKGAPLPVSSLPDSPFILPIKLRYASR